MANRQHLPMEIATGMRQVAYMSGVARVDTIRKARISACVFDQHRATQRDQTKRRPDEGLQPLDVIELARRFIR